jgi:hypothetical protein
LKHAIGVSIARLRLVCAVLLTAGLTAGFAAAGLPEVSTATVAAAAATIADASAREVRSAAGTAAETFAVDSWDPSEIENIDGRVMELALSAARCAIRQGDVRSPSTLTIIDYSKPSTEPRMWVLDLAERRLLYEELVSHGQGSGEKFATRFSNQPDSHQTSIGLFVTDTTYVGRNGYSLRLDGLDVGFNDRARERAIVMHGAPYVNREITKSLGRLGRSHGCPAVRDSVARELIDRVKEGSLVFSYYPDERWLKSSKYFSCAS